ncbi:phosphoglycerate mutase [Salinisphaera orenii MK-B5]|uniref:Phosphoglycerate mutase n=1 Tax=Salinisphaera orenii MK-B5 TaxID=856730 RepID=A0A423PE76_9GAMM|nr:histidine phosphatase family protein [Salinisphaera orenii]ROO23951.1 phosphoglycerate mutase [Salinisphaera orenii MK-B5]
MTGIATTTIDLLRHAECEGGAIFRGSRDVALAAAGWARLRRVAAGVPDWQWVTSSPLIRCRAFAEALAAERGLACSVDARFREMSFGAWEGRPVADVWAEDETAASAWLADPEAHPPPGGEALAAVRARAREGFDDRIDAARGSHGVIVTHGGLMRALLGDLLAMPGTAIQRLATPYACLSRLRVTHAAQGDMLRLVGHNIGGDDVA